MSRAIALLSSFAVVSLFTALSGGEAIVLRNPLPDDQTLVPLRVPLAGGLAVEGRVLPSQTERSAAGEEHWVLADLPKGAVLRPEPSRAAASGPSLVSLSEGADHLELRNDRIAVRVPAALRGDQAPPPIMSMQIGQGPWLGQGAWRNAPACTAYRVEVLGRGPVQLTLIQHWTFADGSSHRLRLRLRPGRDQIEIEERSQATGFAWVFDAAAAWQPNESLFTQHGGGAGKPMNSRIQTGTLLPGQTRLGSTLVHLLPRWSQATDDGWCAAAADASQAIGAVTVRAGQWRWPHEMRLGIELAEDGRALRVVAPLHADGARLWWLRAAGREAWSDGALRGEVMRLAMGDLDKLNRSYVLEWPGSEGATARLPDPFDGGTVNPTGHWRQQARADFRDAEKAGGFGDLLWSQGVLDPDYYGTPWYGWSVQNPNFWTDVLQRPIVRLGKLGTHPRFAELRQLAELALRADLHHSVTLPGGAGQECPGYLGHGIGVWRRLAPIAAARLGFDPTSWDRLSAAEAFLVRISQPDGEQRRMLPMGDTHPAKDGPAVIDISGHDPSRWVSEEFPGLGAILRHRAGTPRETYLAFKAGPNRGHFHGDQLAIHWNSAAKALAVDHHCSYKPRAGQEHMHNRLSFGTAAMPWATMDGHERLIGFATAAGADVAIGEVASTRLRRTTELPPEDWDQRLDVQPLGGELRYRRSLVLLKVLDRDVVIICDEWAGPTALEASFNLHVRHDDLRIEGARATFGDRLTVLRIAPEAATFTRRDWSHDNGGGEATAGLRWTSNAASGRYLTVLWPGADLPACSPIAGGVRIGDVSVNFGAGLDGGAGPAVRVEQQGRELLRLEAVELERSQGDIGLFVPDAGYPFGPIPDWLARQRLARPDWARTLPRLLDPMEAF